MENEATVASATPAVSEEESFESRFRALPKYFNYLALLIAIVFVGFHLYTGLFGRLPALQQRIIHVTLGWMLVWLLVPAHKRLRKNRLAFAIDFLMMLVSLGIGIYVYHNFATYFDRVGMPILFTDLLLGTTAIIFTVELSRRTVGWFFFGVVVAFLLFAFFGPYMPRIIAHRGLSLTKMVSSFFLTTSGIYGMITGVSATYIALFIILAALIRESGVGDTVYQDIHEPPGHSPGRTGENGDRGQFPFRDIHRKFHCQCRRHWLLHHPLDETHRLQTIFCGCRRSRFQFRSTIDAAGHGRFGLYHD